MPSLPEIPISLAFDICHSMIHAIVFDLFISKNETRGHPN